MTSKSELLEGLAFPKNKNSLQKIQEERYPWPLGQHLHPKAASITMPCIATLDWHPARVASFACPAKHTEAQGSAGINSPRAPAISVVCNTGKKSGGGDLHGDVCASLLHSLWKGEEELLVAKPPPELHRLEMRSGGSGNRESLPGVRSRLTASSFPFLCRLERWGGIWQSSRGKQVMNCVETHRQQTEKQVNKHQIPNTEIRNPFSYQLNHSWGAQTNSIRKPRMPERKKNWNWANICSGWSHWEGWWQKLLQDVEQRKQWSNRKQLIRPYRSLWG